MNTTEINAYHKAKQGTSNDPRQVRGIIYLLVVHMA